MQTQRCTKCGQVWWGAHACEFPLKPLKPLNPTMGALRYEWLEKNPPVTVSACACVGPQNGQPLCPCAMRGVIVRDGRYIVPERDLGPVA